jgi:hypothetical protein
MIAVLAVVAVGVWAFNRYRAKAAVLYFEEIPTDSIIALGISSIRLISDTIDLPLKTKEPER